MAHRVYWERENGPVPSGLELDHLCRNPTCVRPDHLEAVTHAENIRRSARAKLTQEKADMIRVLRAEGESEKNLALRFGVTRSAINLVVLRKSWN